MNEPDDMSDLIHSWKEDEMLATQQLLDPTVALRRVHYQATAALLTGIVAVFAVGYRWSEALADGSRSQLAVAVFATGFAVVFLRLVQQIRSRSARAGALLSGSPVEVLQGRRAHLSLQVCSATRPRYVLFTLSVFPIIGGMAALGLLPITGALAVLLPYAAYLVYARLAVLPKYRRELRAVEDLLQELQSTSDVTV